MKVRIFLAAAALLVAFGATLSFAAAPVDDGIDTVVTPPAAMPLPTPYQLDTEMVVQNWILCVSEAFAEQIVRAREIDAASALKAYDELKAAKSCGQFAELRVILQTQVYSAATGSDGGAGAFGALVNFSGAWANAYVVYGGIPAD